MLLICSWAGSQYLAILVIFSLLLASEILRAGPWIFFQQSPSLALFYSIPMSLGCTGVLFTLRIMFPCPPNSLSTTFCTLRDLFSHWFSAYSLWLANSLYCQRPHESWKDFSQFSYSQVSGFCLMVNEGPGSLRVVFFHSSCHASNLQLAVSFSPGEGPMCLWRRKYFSTFLPFSQTLVDYFLALKENLMCYRTISLSFPAMAPSFGRVLPCI